MGGFGGPNSFPVLQLGLEVHVPRALHLPVGI